MPQQEAQLSLGKVDLTVYVHYVTIKHILPAVHCSVLIVLQVGWNP